MALKSRIFDLRILRDTNLYSHWFFCTINLMLEFDIQPIVSCAKYILWFTSIFDTQVQQNCCPSTHLTFVILLITFTSINKYVLSYLKSHTWKITFYRRITTQLQLAPYLIINQCTAILYIRYYVFVLYKK